MKKMLMITIELPYPPTSGGRMKSWHMLKFLSQHYEMGLVCPIKYGMSEVERMSSQLKLRHFFHDTVEIPRNGKTLLQSYFKGVPINVMRSGSELIRKKVSEIANEYDVILLDHYESAQYVPKNFKGKVIFHTHNATYVMWERYANSDANIAFRIATGLEAYRVKAYELNVTQRADVIFASPNDIDSLVKIGANKDKFRVTYHLGDDSQLSLPSIEFDQTEKSLLYVGTLNWEANVDGLLWFFEEVWPAVKSKHSDLKFYVVGGNPDSRLIDAAKGLQDVIFTGFVDELEPYFKKSRLFMAPLRFGAGIKVKVLNAMCRGLPTITTPVGCEGLATTDMIHLSISETSVQMIDAINVLLVDKEKWRKIEIESRKIVEERYTWNKVLGYMIEEIDKVLVEEKQ